MADPKRLLEITQDAPSPNVLVQNLLGVARTESAPDGARRRARRSVDGVFTPASKAPVTKAEAGVAKGVTAPSTAAVADAPPKPPLPPRPTPSLKSAPPKALPPPNERRPAPGCGEPCGGCTPYG